MQRHLTLFFTLACRWWWRKEQWRQRFSIVTSLYSSLYLVAQYSFFSIFSLFFVICCSSLVAFARMCACVWICELSFLSFAFIPKLIYLIWTSGAIRFSSSSFFPFSRWRKSVCMCRNISDYIFQCFAWFLLRFHWIKL